jgi:hypothetical protein
MHLITTQLLILRRAGPGLQMPIAAWAAVPALALLCLALAGWQYYVQTRRVSRLHDPWNSGELDLPALRSLGERAAKKYGGLTGMGTPTARSAYAPVDWARVAESCAPRGGNATRGGGRVVFVTGAAGFIGMHTCVALRRRGDAVVGLDNFNGARWRRLPTAQPWDDTKDMLCLLCSLCSLARSPSLPPSLSARTTQTTTRCSSSARVRRTPPRWASTSPTATSTTPL